MTATMADLLTRPGCFTRWPDMSRDTRALAAALLLKTGWPGVDISQLPELATFDSHTGITLVSRVPNGGLDSHSTWSARRPSTEDTLAYIEVRFGAETLAKVEEVIAR